MANASPQAKTTPTTHVQTSKPSGGDLSAIASALGGIENAINPISAAASAVSGQGGIAAALNPLNWFSQALGNSSPKDLMERGALMVFGAILVITGIVLFVQSSREVRSAEKEAGTAAVAA